MELVEEERDGGAVEADGEDEEERGPDALFGLLLLLLDLELRDCSLLKHLLGAT